MQWFEQGQTNASLQETSMQEVNHSLVITSQMPEGSFWKQLYQDQSSVSKSQQSVNGLLSTMEAMESQTWFWQTSE